MLNSHRSKSRIPYPLTHKHVLLLTAYKSERNKTQAQKAIDYNLGIDMNMGRHVLPKTQELIDWGLIQRTNPQAPASKGHRNIITEQGLYELDCYFEKLNSIASPNPQYGF